MRDDIGVLLGEEWVFSKWLQIWKNKIRFLLILYTKINSR